MNKLKRFITPLLGLLAAGLLIGSLRLPLWCMRMEAPQYQGQEALKVFVLPGSLQGDLREIQVLDKYIGVTIPNTLPQTRWLPTVLLLFAALEVAATFLPLRLRRRAAFVVAMLLSVAMLTAAVQAQLQMYHIGHDRDPHPILKGVEDFTPPLLGNRKLAQFELSSRLGLGAFAIAGAVVLLGAMGIAARPQKTSSCNSKCGCEALPSSRPSEVSL